MQAWARKLVELARRQPRSTARSRSSREAPARPAYAGDFEGEPPISYAPLADAHPDPGEVVWAWIPYEDDHSRGKDRPAVVIGRAGRHLLALPLTSQDHDRDAAQEARAGRHWFDIGAGAWDASGRPSEARVDRIVRLEPDAVRRAGAALSRPVFDALAGEVRRVRRRR